MTQLALFCVLRFPLKGALVPECLSEYAREHFYWSGSPSDMLTFMTMNGTAAAVEDIVKRSKTAHQFCYIAVPVEDVPIRIASAVNGAFQVFQPWALEHLNQYNPKTRGQDL